ncbi:WcaI family glycosyltransferase [Polaribacter sp. SA4-12]|uniref:WcaI family glycosyltransferase n=1 Tax=Polaribacter sp. SA4-12 TaxID=1312072 RepID=UPI000B3C8ACE|nr:WcaI family glycosyltransferase [Polaribacter sp. SA4-12]ARV15519.1 glycosyl transferase [Polaribacter sp. SA4-12]
MNKSITIIGINYYPEDTAIGLYTSQLAEYFNEKNIDVTVVSGFPYYPAWRITDEYKSKKTFYSENINGIKILRYKQYVPKNPTFLKRILHLLDFSLGTFINILKIKETDVVICVVPFIGSVFLGKILAKSKKAKLWVHVQDFEFDAVSDSNLVENKTNKNFVFKGLFWVEKKLLKSADLLSTISSSMISKLHEKVKLRPESKKLLPNWVDSNFIKPEDYKVHRYLTSSKFKILYSGNIGEKQDWVFFIEFVKELECIDDIEIIVVGNGSKRIWLEEQLLDLDNIYFYSPVKYSELSNLLCSADLHVLFQKIDVIDTVMPSKILAMMSSEKPSLITGNLKSEVYSIIRKSNSGKYFETSDICDVLEFVKKLKLDKPLQEEYGKNARTFVSENFSKTKILNQFMDTFEKLIE